MAQFIKHFVQDLQQDIGIRQCGTIVFNKDNLSDVITVEIYNGGEAYSDGGTVVGAVVCPDGKTVSLTGSLSGNVATVTLTGDCFAIPGQIGVGVQIITGSKKTTVLKAVYLVEVLETDSIIDPGSRMTVSVGDLVQDIENAVATMPTYYTDFMAAMAPTFSDQTAYKAGQYVWYGGKLYLFTSDHAAGSWVDTPPKDAILIAVGSEINDLKSAISVRRTVPYSYATALSSGDTYWSISTARPIPKKGNTYIMEIVPNETFILDNIQIGTAGSGASMVDTIAENVSFTANEAKEITFTPSADNLRYIRFYQKKSSIESVTIKYKGLTPSTYIMPELFGAVGDGTVDDTYAWQNCIDYAAVNMLAIRCETNKTYSVSGLIICNWRNIDFNYCTMKSSKTAGSDGGQAPIIIVNNDSEHDPLGTDPNNNWHGSIRNLILDGNNATRCAFMVTKDWRGDYENLYVKNMYAGPDTSHLSIAFDINAAGGSLFNGLRGRGTPTGYDMFIRMSSPDATIQNVDYQNFRYGIHVLNNCRIINAHGYIASQDLYEGSYFMKLRGSCLLEMLYPDTQQNAFIIERAGYYMINNVVFMFNSNTITKTGEQYAFYVDTENGGDVTNCRITNAYSVVHNGEYTLCNVDGLPVYASALNFG